ncbi:MAG: squalene/phytoene synthase family protein [Proteobacteria bacterium]|nr:squalene/phytoene synthase family protein [Pseudomonadota bacterium]
MSDPAREQTPTQSMLSAAIRPGSLNWFTCLYAAPAPRIRLRALFAFRHACEMVVQRVQEPDIARIKLAWWREEIGRYANGNAVHPLCKSLLDEHDEPLLDPATMARVIDAAQMDLAKTRYPQPDDLLRYCRLGGGSLLSLQAEILHGKAFAVDHQDALLNIGSWIRLIELLRDLRVNLAVGQLYLPLQWLDESALTIADLASDHPQPAAVKIARLLGELTRTQIVEQEDNVAAGKLSAHPSAAASLAMHRRLFDKMHGSDYQDVFLGKTALSAFEMMRVSWRAARRAARQD